MIKLTLLNMQKVLNYKFHLQIFKVTALVTIILPLILMLRKRLIFHKILKNNNQNNSN